MAPMVIIYCPHWTPVGALKDACRHSASAKTDYLRYVALKALVVQLGAFEPVLITHRFCFVNRRQDERLIWPLRKGRAV